MIKILQISSTQIIRVVFTLLFFNVSALTFAQQDLELDNRLLVKFSPFSLAEPETVVFQGGLEYFFSPKVSVQSEIGFNGGVFGVPSGRRRNEDFSLWRSKSEIKFHQKEFYWGFEFFLVQKDLIRNDDSFTPFQQQIWYQQARIDFEVYGAAVKFGRQVFISDNILLDFFAGYGLRSRYREVTVIELSDNQQGTSFSGQNNPLNDRYRYLGWDYIQHFSLGLKMSFLVRKKNTTPDLK
jgi:hypothetical protein